MWGLVPGYGFNRAFETINRANLWPSRNPTCRTPASRPSLAYGAHKSKLFAALSTSSAYANACTLSADERLRLTMWMDANAPYHDRS